MKTSFWVSILVFAGLLSCSTAYTATYDLTGTWNYTLSDCWAVGGINCDPGPEASGTCVIEQTGDYFAFAFTSGVTCDPPESCTFSGSVADKVYTCSTTDIVDDENGTVTSKIFVYRRIGNICLRPGIFLLHPSQRPLGVQLGQYHHIDQKQRRCTCHQLYAHSKPDRQWECHFGPVRRCLWYRDNRDPYCGSR